MSNRASMACGEGTAMAETRKLAAFLRRMWSDSASLPGPTRSGHLPASELLFVDHVAEFVQLLHHVAEIVAVHVRRRHLQVFHHLLELLQQEHRAAVLLL